MPGLSTVELLFFDLELTSYLWGDSLKEYKYHVLHQIFTTSFSIHGWFSNPDIPSICSSWHSIRKSCLFCPLSYLAVNLHRYEIMDSLRQYLYQSRRYLYQYPESEKHYLDEERDVQKRLISLP